MGICSSEDGTGNLRHPMPRAEICSVMPGWKLEESRRVRALEMSEKTEVEEDFTSTSWSSPFLAEMLWLYLNSVVLIMY